MCGFFFVRTQWGGVDLPQLAGVIEAYQHAGAIVLNNPTVNRGGNITTLPHKARINLSDAVDDLAPAPPPCYHNKQHWIQYLKSAAAAQNQRDEPKIIIFIRGEPVINRNFDFCEDCDYSKRTQMREAKRCKPDWMLE